MRLVLDPPETDCMEWTLLGKEKPDSLYQRLKNLEETPVAFQKRYGPYSSMMFLKSEDERPIAGNYIYVIQFTGNDVRFGHKLVTYMADQMNLDIMQLLVFLKGAYSTQFLAEWGYKFKSTTGKCSLFAKELNLYLTSDGVFFQIRAKKPKEWEHLSGLIKKEIELLKPNYEKKRA